MFDPPMTDGVELFLYIFIGLVSFGAALTAIDVRRTNSGQED